MVQDFCVYKDLLLDVLVYRFSVMKGNSLQHILLFHTSPLDLRYIVIALVLAVQMSQIFGMIFGFCNVKYGVLENACFCFQRCIWCSDVKLFQDMQDSLI